MKVKSESEVAQSCPTLHDPMDCSLPGASIHGIFQARVLEWGAIAFSETYYKHENTFDVNLDYLAEAVQFLHYKFTLLFPLSKLNSLAGRCYVQLTPKEWGLTFHLLERKYLPELLRILHDKICLFSHNL